MLPLTMPYRPPSSRSRSSVLRWLVLVLIASSQLAFAFHQIHHDSELGETCAVCLQLDRDDQGPLSDNDPERSSLDKSETAIVRSAHAPAVPITRYRSRASP